MAQPARAFNRVYFSSGSYGSYIEDVSSWVCPMARKTSFFLHDIRNPRVLDIGCAEGFLLAELKETYGYSVEGVEFSHHVLARALPEIKPEIRRGSVLELELAANRYDAVICFDVFEYMTPEENEIAAARLVKWAGRFIFFTNPYKHSFQASQRLNPDPLRITAFTQKEYIEMFKRAGARFLTKFNAGSGGDVLVFEKNK